MTRPRHVKQLQTGTPTAAHDCGPAATLMALQGACDGLRVPRDEQAEWIRLLRLQMTHPSFWPATSLPVLAEAVGSDIVEGAYAAEHRQRPHGVGMTVTHQQAMNYLDQHCWLVVGIDYGRLNDLMPHLSGSTFRGGHFIALGPLPGAVAMLGDPLHDGRRPGIPRGWQTVHPMRYLRAAETFGGRSDPGHGRAKIMVVRPPGGL